MHYKHNVFINKLKTEKLYKNGKKRRKAGRCRVGETRNYKTVGGMQ